MGPFGWWNRKRVVRRFAPAPQRAGRRKLAVESLESRRLLSVAPQPLGAPGQPYYNQFAEFQNQVYFHGDGLWRTDGTPAGTTAWNIIQSTPRKFTALDTRLIVEGQSFVYSTDGTAAGTTFLSSTFDTTVTPLPRVGNVVAFVDPAAQLWKTDGTLAGTVQMGAARVVARDNTIPFPGNLLVVDSAVVGSTVYFMGRPGAAENVYGVELFKADLSSTGTTLVKDIYPGIGYGAPQELVNVNGTLFFTARDSALTPDRSLWKSDGTSAGTVRVSPNLAPQNPEGLVNVNGVLYFTADDGQVSGRELWRSDGTCSGTFMVRDITPGPVGGMDWHTTPYPAPFKGPAGLYNVNGTLLFRANDGIHGFELWRSDGTSAGTVMIRDINPSPLLDGPWLSPASTAPWQDPVVNGVLYFAADDGGATGGELWRSDGTTAGTYLVGDLLPGAESSRPTNFQNVGGVLYFTATTPWQGSQYNPVPQVWSFRPTPQLATAAIDARAALGFDARRNRSVEADTADGLFAPLSVAYDAQDNLYVADVFSGAAGRVLKIDAHSGRASVFADVDDGLIAPTGLAFDGAGNLFVTSYLTHTLWKFNSAGVGSVFADAADGLSGPFGVDVDPVSGAVYVVSLDNNRVLKFDAAGNGQVFADAADGLFAPIGVAVDAAGGVYVSDTLLGRVTKFTPAGVGSVFADAADGLVTPTGMSFDAAGNLFVANYLANRVTRVTPAGVGTTFADAANGVVRPFDVALPVGAAPLPAPPGPRGASSASLFTQRLFAADAECGGDPLSALLSRIAQRLAAVPWQTGQHAPSEVAAPVAANRSTPPAAPQAIASTGDPTAGSPRARPRGTISGLLASLRR